MGLMAKESSVIFKIDPKHIDLGMVFWMLSFTCKYFVIVDLLEWWASKLVWQ